jgi:hypothetical protein
MAYTGADIEAVGQYVDSSSFDKIDASTFASTTTGKKEVGKAKKAKILSYPLARRQEQDTDYLEIVIAEYQAPGLALQGVSFTNTKSSGDSSNLASTTDDSVLSFTKGTGKDKIKDENPSFSLKTGSESNRKKKVIKSIINLPIPRNVTDSQGVQYGESSLNPLEATGLSAVAAGVDPAGSVQALKNAFNTLAKGSAEVLANTEVQGAIGAAVAGTAIGALGGNVSADQLISRATGQILNPNLELLFNGVGIRTFPFSFQFFPRNRSEGQVVMDIIRTLKIEMAPSRTTKSEAKGIFIKAPSVFHLKYKKGNSPHPFLNRFQPAVLSDMKVNYTAAGSHSTFYDGTPTHIQVDMQFKELNPIFREDYTSVGGVGY